jgi:erythromycin esterase-like protein
VPKPPRSQGTIHYEDGRPAGGVVVRIGDKGSGDQRAVAVSDRDGVYGVNLPAGTYVVTAASDSGWVMLAEASVGDKAPDLFLRRECRQVRAAVSPDVGDSVVAFTRLSEQSGDTFLGTPRRGRLTICLPDAAFAVDTSGALRSTRIPLDTRESSTVRISAHLRSSVERAYAGAEIPRRNLASFATAAATGTTLVGIGEANHGSRAFLEVRLALSLELARSHGFNAILLEAGFGEVMALDDYVHGKDIDVARAVQELGYWMWDTEDFHAVLRALRSYNEAAAPDARVSLMGIDVQDSSAVVTAILKDERLPLSEHERRMIQPLAESRARGASKLSKDELERLLGLLDEIQGGTRTHAQPTTPLAARALRYRVNAVTADLAESARVRDLGMADMAAEILRTGAATKAIIWAHNAHVGREAAYGIPMMGSHLASTLGDRYFPVALLAGNGEARAWDARGEIGVIPHQLPRLPAHYVEGALEAKAGDQPVFVLFDDSAAFTTWLAVPRYVREFGAAIEDQPRLRDMLTAFRAVAFVPHVRETKPTATGVRKAETP